MPAHEPAATAPSRGARAWPAGLPALDRPAWLEIDTDALAANVGVLRAEVAAGTQVWPVVKDDAYGHGIEVATRSFLRGGAEGVCVATLEEALVIRAAGIGIPVLILYPVPQEAVVDAARAGLAISVSTDHGAASVARAWAASTAASTAAAGLRLDVHVEVETGFTRMGVDPGRLGEALDALALPGIHVAAVWSHLATPEDAASSGAQETRLAEASAVARGRGVEGTHLAASGGLLTGRGVTSMLVRPGLLAYGVLPDGPLGDGPTATRVGAGLRPAMRLVARPIRIADVPAGTRVGYGGTWVAARPSRIATLPVGYGDGYARAYAGSDALVRGRRVPLVGRVSMDSCTVDLTDVPEAGLADEVVLLGRQGADAILPLELAQRRTTIPWEVLTGMARRLTRVYDAATGPSGVRTLAGETLVR